MNKIFQNIIVIKLIVFILLIPIKSTFVSEWSGIFAQTNQSCEQYLEKAEDAYYDGEFNDSLEFIRLCLKESNINDEQMIRAYKILTRTFMAMDQVEKAKEYIKKILELKNDYLPTIEEETPKYVNTVILVKNELAKQSKMQEKEKSGFNSWLWIGAGSVVAITTAIVVISNGNEKKNKEDNPLPQPPDFP